MYVMVATQLDLAYVVRVTNHYMSKTGHEHWEVVKHIFRYLHGTEDIQLTFRSDKLTEVEGFMHSDYIDNPDNRKSTSGYVFTY